MKERPILFSAPMVRALLDGSKTQTRRVFTRPKGYEVDNAAVARMAAANDPFLLRRCPYGQPGDQLWVRESWAAHWMYDNVPPRQARSGQLGDNYWFRADPDHAQGSNGCDPVGHRGKWRVSIHMPHFASRIQLEIVSVRVERLNDISESDAIAEGIENNPKLDPAGTCHWRIYGNGGGGTNLPEHSYETLWEQINGAGSWQVSPWVWVVEFKRVGGGS